MKNELFNPVILRKKGMEALVKELGPVGAARFIQMFEPGYGDFTKERKEIFKNKSVDEINEEIKRNKI